MSLKISERANGSFSVSKVFEGDTRTEQSHKNEVNINSILAKSRRTGRLPYLAGRSFGDFTSDLDYKAALDQITKANSDFMSLPSDVREFFKNDPSNLLEFMNDESNRSQAEKLGLVESVPESPVMDPEPDESTPE